MEKKKRGSDPTRVASNPAVAVIARKALFCVLVDRSTEKNVRRYSNFSGSQKIRGHPDENMEGASGIERQLGKGLVDENTIQTLLNDVL